MTKSAADVTITSMKESIEQVIDNVELAINQGVRRLFKEESWCGIGQILDNLDTYLPSDSQELKIIEAVIDMTRRFDIG